LSLGVIGFLVTCGVLAIAAPAWAHFPELSGETVCSDATHVITWTIANSETDKVMTITSASASDGTNSYAVTGYSPMVGDSGSTNATTLVPGGVTGTITLTVTGSWTDGVTATRQTSVELIESCSPSTTTSTTSAPETSTTIGPETSTLPASTTTITEAGSTTTTDQPAGTTTSVAVEGSTVLLPTTSTSSPSTIVAPSGTLPFTGGSFFGLLALGVSCLLAGALFLVRRRRSVA
jgi:hypothetical protein